MVFFITDQSVLFIGVIFTYIYVDLALKQTYAVSNRTALARSLAEQGIWSFGVLQEFLL